MAVSQPDLKPGLSAPNTDRIGLWRRIVAVVLAVALPVQAFLGSDALYKANDTARNSHEMFGNIFFLLAVVQLVLAFVAMRNGSANMLGVGLSAFFVLLIVAQLGLGYSGRENIDPRIWHIANGVLLTVVAAVITTMSFYRKPTA